MDDQIRDIDMLKELKTQKQGHQWSNILLSIYYKLIQCSLKKHSIRSDTNNICKPIAIASNYYGKL